MVVGEHLDSLSEGMAIVSEGIIGGWIWVEFLMKATQDSKSVQSAEGSMSQTAADRQTPVSGVMTSQHYFYSRSVFRIASILPSRSTCKLANGSWAVCKWTLNNYLGTWLTPQTLKHRDRPIQCQQQIQTSDQIRLLLSRKFWMESRTSCRS